jgi:hypothetical protein
MVEIQSNHVFVQFVQRNVNDENLTSQPTRYPRSSTMFNGLKKTVTCDNCCDSEPVKAIVFQLPPNRLNSLGGSTPAWVSSCVLNVRVKLRVRVKRSNF